MLRSIRAAASTPSRTTQSGARMYMQPRGEEDEGRGDKGIRNDEGREAAKKPQTQAADMHAMA